MNEIKSGLTSLIVRGLNDEKLINRKFMDQVNGIYETLSRSSDVDLNDIFPVLTKLNALWILIQIEGIKKKNKSIEEKKLIEEKKEQLENDLSILKDIGFNIKNLIERYNNFK